MFKKHAATLKNRRLSKLVQKDNCIEKIAFLRSCRRDCFISKHTKMLHCGLGRTRRNLKAKPSLGVCRLPCTQAAVRPAEGARGNKSLQVASCAACPAGSEGVLPATVWGGCLCEGLVARPLGQE